MSHTERIDLLLIKTIRVIFDDPYATDSSSDDEAISVSNSRRPTKPKPRKRFVSTICVPTLIKRYKSYSKSVKTEVGNRKSSSKFKGVRRRPSAEIRNPIEKKRKRFGTFSTQEEEETCERSRREFQEQFCLVNQTGLTKPERHLINSTKPCALRKQEKKEVGLNKPYDLLPLPSSSILTSSSNGKTVNTDIALEKILDFGCHEEEEIIERMLEEPLLTPSISDLFKGSALETEEIWFDHYPKDISSILDEPKLETLKKNKHQIECKLKYNGSTDVDTIINDLLLQDFPMYDFGSLGEITNLF